MFCCLIIPNDNISFSLIFVALRISEFHIQLENPHVIGGDQVWVGTLAKGPDNVTLSSAYETR